MREQNVITEEMTEEALRGVEVGVLSQSHPELVGVIVEAAAQHAAFFLIWDRIGILKELRVE